MIIGAAACCCCCLLLLLAFFVMRRRRNNSDSGDDDSYNVSHYEESLPSSYFEDASALDATPPSGNGNAIYAGFGDVKDTTITYDSTSNLVPNEYESATSPLGGGGGNYQSASGVQEKVVYTGLARDPVVYGYCFYFF